MNVIMTSLLLHFPSNLSKIKDAIYGEKVTGMFPWSPRRRHRSQRPSGKSGYPHPPYQGGCVFSLQDCHTLSVEQSSNHWHEDMRVYDAMIGNNGSASRSSPTPHGGKHQYRILYRSFDVWEHNFLILLRWWVVQTWLCTHHLAVGDATLVGFVFRRRVADHCRNWKRFACWFGISHSVLVWKIPIH